MNCIWAEYLSRVSWVHWFSRNESPCTCNDRSLCAFCLSAIIPDHTIIHFPHTTPYIQWSPSSLQKTTKSCRQSFLSPSQVPSCAIVVGECKEQVADGVLLSYSFFCVVDFIKFFSLIFASSLTDPAFLQSLLSASAEWIPISNRFLLQPSKHYAIEFMVFLQMYVSNSCLPSSSSFLKTFITFLL